MNLLGFKRYRWDRVGFAVLLQDGQTIRDTYEVERFLGEGAFAEVYRVRHRFLGRQAMKVLKTAGLTIGEVEEMLSEAVLLSRIGHPNIVRVFNADVLETGAGTFGFFTMEYVPGGSLDQYWRSYRSKFMPVEEVVEIAKQVCAGICVAHSENPPLIHRDIKPQNILVGYDGAGMRVRVSDFGLAKRANPLTLLVSSRGTLGFKPPESLDNIDSCWADVWAMGTTMYLLLTDVLPFPLLQDRDITDATRFLGPLRSATTYNIHVDAALDAILARCLAKKPSERYSNAMELLTDLSRWRPGQSVGHQPRTITTDTSKDALGSHSLADKAAATTSVREAQRLSREPGKLMVAADILEEALNKDPDLRDRYESQLVLWRRGVVM